MVKIFYCLNLILFTFAALGSWGFGASWFTKNKDGICTRQDNTIYPAPLKVRGLLTLRDMGSDMGKNFFCPRQEGDRVV